MRDESAVSSECDGAYHGRCERVPEFDGPACFLRPSISLHSCFAAIRGTFVVVV